MASYTEPVVIGGLRGSGTRVAAHLVRELGVYLGENLNDALDDQSFGFLLGGRPDWYRDNPRHTAAALRIVAKLVRGEGELSANERALVGEAMEEWADRLSAATYGGSIDRADFLRRRIKAAVRRGEMPVGAAGWGWKSPSAHVFLEDLASAFPSMRYIHVIRDGAELTGKAKTRREVELWGPLLGVPPEAVPSPAEAVLRYSEVANRRAMSLGPRFLGERFTVFRYARACSAPAEVAREMAGFLGLEASTEVVEFFEALVVPGPERERAAARGAT